MIQQRGFTLIELLTVVAIIGMLVTVVTVSLRRVNTKAKYARAKADMSDLIKMIDVARLQSGKTFGQITGSYCSECACRWNVRTAPQSCWDNYAAAFQKISVAAEPGGIKIESPPRDPWGAPYLINENEGEHCCCSDTVTWCCTDNILSAGPNGTYFDSDDIVVNIPTRLCSPSLGGHHSNMNWE